MNIGEKIRKLRKAKKTTLAELSKIAGVDLATLSRIETNKMVGSVKSHQAIAKALGINLSELYSNIEPENKAVEFQSKKNQTETFIHNDKASYHMLTTNVLSKRMMPVVLNIASYGKSSAEELPKGTERFIYVLKGKCKTYIGSQEYILKKGETLYFDGSLRHYFKNIGGQEFRAISIFSPPAL